MSLFDRYKKKHKDYLRSEWLSIENNEELDQALQASFQTNIILFKHSLTCGISHSALSKFYDDWGNDPISMPFYFIDLLTYRSISNKIAEELQVIHQSPQIIVVSKAKSIYTASHNAIRFQEVKKFNTTT